MSESPEINPLTKSPARTFLSDVAEYKIIANACVSNNNLYRSQKCWDYLTPSKAGLLKSLLT
jgi:hypothetical protein